MPVRVLPKPSLGCGCVRGMSAGRCLRPHRLGNAKHKCSPLMEAFLHPMLSQLRNSISTEQNSSNTPLPQCWFKLHQAENQKQLPTGLKMILTPSPLWDIKTEHSKFTCPILILQTGTSCSNPKRWLLALQNPAYARTACSIIAFNFRPHKVPICTEQFLLLVLLQLCSQWFLHTA